VRIVLDTNVLVSGLLSPFGPPGQIVRMVSAGVVTLCIDARVMAEYEEVLLRAKFGFDPDDGSALLDYLDFRGEVVAASPLFMRLPAPDDEPFLEVALSCAADCLVTGNIAHFPAEARLDALVVSPGEFMEIYRARHVGGAT
jgi:putative PIN family toxin of toxin-antitoxin system